MYTLRSQAGLGKVIKVSLAHTLHKQTAARMALRAAFGRYSQGECHPLASFHQPKGFTEVRQYMAVCERGLVIFCLLGHGPLFTASRWLNITTLMAQGFDILGLRVAQTLVFSRKELLKFVKDVEACAGSWHHAAVFNEYSRRAASWKSQVHEMYRTAWQGSTFWRGQFKAWGISEWHHCWCLGLSPPPSQHPYRPAVPCKTVPHPISVVNEFDNLIEDEDEGFNSCDEDDDDDDSEY